MTRPAPRRSTTPHAVVLTDASDSQSAALEVIRELLGPRWDVGSHAAAAEGLAEAWPRTSRWLGQRRDVRNRALHAEQIRQLNLRTRLFAALIARRARPAIARSIRARLAPANTELVISTSPWAHGAAVLAAAERGVPALLIALQADPTLWLTQLPPLHPRDRILLSAAHRPTRNALERAGIPAHQTVRAGHPLRSAFDRPADPRRARVRLGIPADRFTLLLQAGGLGRDRVLAYLTALRRARQPIHVILAAGHRTDLTSAAQRLGGRSITTLGYEPQFAPYLAAADLVLARPGSSTLAECLQVGVPQAADLSQPTLFWERPNRQAILDGHLGFSFEAPGELPALVQRLLDHPEVLVGARQRIAQHRRSAPVFAEVFRSVVAQTLPHAAPSTSPHESHQHFTSRSQPQNRRVRSS